MRRSAVFSFPFSRCSLTLALGKMARENNKKLNYRNLKIFLKILRLFISIADIEIKLHFGVQSYKIILP
jgi:hypothetical protein